MYNLFSLFILLFIWIRANARYPNLQMQLLCCSFEITYNMNTSRCDDHLAFQSLTVMATLLLRPFISRSADMPSWTQPCGAPLFWVICSARIRVAMNLSLDCNTPAMQSGNESKWLKLEMSSGSTHPPCKLDQKISKKLILRGWQCSSKSPAYELYKTL